MIVLLFSVVATVDKKKTPVPRSELSRIAPLFHERAIGWIVVAGQRERRRVARQRASGDVVGQQIRGAVGLAGNGRGGWTLVNRHGRGSLSHVAAGHNLAGPAAARPGSPIYDHALSSGVTTALTMGAGATVLALIITVIAIRVRREDLPDSPLVM